MLIGWGSGTISVGGFQHDIFTVGCEKGVDVWKNSQKGSREVGKCAV